MATIPPDKIIRKAKQDDIRAIVDIHINALKSDLLPRLGVKYLKSYFFPTVLKSRHALTLVVVEDSSVIGFVVFALNRDELSKELERPPAWVYLQVIKAAVRNFQTLRDIIGYMFEKPLTVETGRGVDAEQPGELFLIAIDPKQQSRGLGRELIAFAATTLATMRPSCIVKTSSHRAKLFYENNGFKKLGEQCRASRKFHVLYRDFAE